jgi:4-hydroxybenzoate polyprenyltransferase
VTVAGLAAAREIAKDIKLSHSVFALPFALLGAAMAMGAQRPAPRDAALLVALVVGCMVSARTAAMVANRLLDRDIDARNPRTAGRALPAGRISVAQARAAFGLSAAAFAGLCALFGVLLGNWWPLWLSVPVLAWISAYGLLKRFSMLCHVWLGASLAMSPLAAAIAVRPDALAAPAPWFLAGAVLLWVAGFDVLYAMQDTAVDVREGLHSMPSRLGDGRAAWVSRAMHAGSVAMLVACWRLDPRLGTAFGVAVGVAAAVIGAEHLLLATGGAPRFARHFTLLNGIVSIVLGATGILSVAASHG